MKIIKKLLCICLSAILALCILPVVSFAENDTTLKFGADGKFKIMMFADSQDDENLEATTTQLMNEALDTYKPDLVVFLGDNTVAQGEEKQYEAIKAVTEPCVSRNVPYAIVFGNHDQEQGVEKEVLLEMYQEFGCLTYDAAPAIHGCGSCNLPVYSSDGSKMAMNLWLIDSNSSHPDDPSVGGYEIVYEDQIEWYKATSEAIKAANGGVAVPSFNFQHIVVPEVYDALGCPAVPGLKTGAYPYMGKSYIPVPNPAKYTGLMCEHPCPPYSPDGQLDAWLEEGDVIASFFGHDHTNTFTTWSNGIALTTVPSVGCNSYSSDITRGVGLLTVDENDVENYSYELIKMYDMALADGSQLTKVDGGKKAIYYRFVKLFADFLEKVLHAFAAMPIGK